LRAIDIAGQRRNGRVDPTYACPVKVDVGAVLNGGTLPISNDGPERVAFDQIAQSSVAD
jgi:hypothetical protein